MVRVREVGTLWIGGSLSWMEQLCLKSFVDQGQQITLFSYEPIPNVPEGVIRRDGREVLDTDNFLKYEKKDSFALFADLFRLHMIARNPGMIWVDTDVYCLRPMDYDADHVLGFELPGGARVNNAVLGLPADGPLLRAMLDYTSDVYGIPPFVKGRLQEEYRAAAAAGQPVHVSQQPWGVWGPMMVTHFTHALGLADQVQPLDAFYPVTFPDRLKFLRPAAVAEGMITPHTTALHLWASNKRELGLRHHGIPPAGSYLDKLLRLHDIQAEAAPIKGRGKHVFDAGLVDRLDIAEAQTFADLGGNAQSLALAAWNKWDCDIQLIDIDHKGNWPATPSPWVVPYTAFLTAHGVPEAKIARISRAGDLRPVDVIANLSGFGDVNKVKHLEAVLKASLHAQTRMLTDIRKGSGAYPLLNAYGSCETVTTRDADGVTITRALFRAGPQAVAQEAPTPPEEGSWAEIATTLAGQEGFFRDSPEHSVLFIKRSDTLVVTFDNLDIAMGKREDRRPWGFSFIEKQGWSMLGVMANGWTWYRDPWVWQQFDALRDSGFFKQFKRVVFYGASMGGYAACAFVAACPGADVVAISPQSTLDKALVPWETRYHTAWGRDYSGPYGDAAQASHAAGRVFLLYDPYEPLDTGHADRFTGANVVKLRAPLLGHRLGSSLQQMGILAPITLAALNGTLTEAEFYRTLRARKTFPRYQRELFKRALDRGRPGLARKLGRWVLTRGDNRFIRQGMLVL
ncbi:hypothetical protein [Pseudotabrizicola alkalilacus]|uniref:Alpha 1,4-glycosyltransferase domain-containing protein n=1 Tax=Pseudotabrizicola alkalilacus TaxID=2305252 RepID=A0A411Z4B9_9RHOB|nr:hypothetical protein [Pseudotabrizicola alkalilacus]RGP37895.1 hypothetical protein D1012_08390 [Pseudotabrizicola alkalilacus]